MKKVISFILTLIITMGISVNITKAGAIELTLITLKSGQTVEITNLEGIDLEISSNQEVVSNNFDIVKYKYNSNNDLERVEDIQGNTFLQIDNTYKGKQVITNNGKDMVSISLPTKYASKITYVVQKALDRYSITKGESIEINIQYGMEIRYNSYLGTMKPVYDLVECKGNDIINLKRNTSEDLVFDYQWGWYTIYNITVKGDLPMNFLIPGKYGEFVQKTKKQSLTELKVRGDETLRYNGARTDNMIVYSENVKYDSVLFATRRDIAYGLKPVFKMDLYKDGILNTKHNDELYYRVNSFEMTPYTSTTSSFYVPTMFLDSFEIIKGTAVIRETLNKGDSLKVGRLTKTNDVILKVEFLGRTGTGESKTYDNNGKIIDSFQGNRTQITNQGENITVVKSNVDGAALAYPTRYRYFVTYEFDVNYDEIIDVFDLAEIASGYGNKANTGGSYDSNRDLTKDGVIDIYDIVSIAKCLE